MTPRRIQLKRTKGWRMPANTVKVDRTTPFGNPFVVGQPGGVYSAKVIDRRHAWQLFASIAADTPKLVEAARTHLKGKNLACWCPLPTDPYEPDCCHAAVLLKIANEDNPMTDNPNNTSLPDTGVDARIETGWLIEHEKLPGYYWTGQWGRWGNHAEACRFARHEDAFKVSLNLGDVCEYVHKIHEHQWVDNGKKFVHSALSARASVAVAVGVKALEWSHDNSWIWSADNYTITDYRDVAGFPFPDKPFELREFGMVENDQFATIAEAKAAAQSDFEARIRASLTAPVEETVEPVAWRWHDGDRWIYEDTAPSPEGEGCEVHPLYAASTPSEPKLHGPFGWLNGHRDLSEDSWELENDPLENSDEYFAIPLFALVDPFKEAGKDFARASATSPSIAGEEARDG